MDRANFNAFRIPNLESLGEEFSVGPLFLFCLLIESVFNVPLETYLSASCTESETPATSLF